MRNKWTENEKEFLRDNNNILNNTQLGECLGRSKDSVRLKKHHLGLGLDVDGQAAGGRPDTWTNDDIKYLRENVDLLNNADLARHFGRKIHAVTSKLYYEGIKRSPQVLKSIKQAKRPNSACPSGTNHSNWRGKSVKTYKRAAYRRYYKNNREKVAARRAVKYAIKTGKIVAKKCEVCSSGNTEAHHDDYAKPLIIRWLCREHHRSLHNE